MTSSVGAASIAGRPGSAVAIDWRAVAPALLAVFVLGRLVVVLIAVLVDVGPMAPTADRRLWTETPVLASLSIYDGLYYLGIASSGYHAEPVYGPYHDTVFFPMYPLVVRLLSPLTGGEMALAGVLVSNLAFLAAMIVLYRLARPYLGHRAALRSVAYLSIAPGAVAFAMTYPDSLFLLFTAGAFLAAEQGERRLTGLLYALATLTRLPGILLGLPLLLVLAARREGGGLRAITWLGLGPLALLVFYGYLGWLTGDPLANLAAQTAWSPAGVAPATGGSIEARLDPLVLVLAAVLLTHVFLLVFVRTDRMAPGYVAHAVLGILTVLAAGRLPSLARYLAVVFPFSWLLAARESAWFRLGWPIASGVLFISFAIVHFRQVMVP